MTDNHINSLVSSLAKKGLLFSDAKDKNIGLMSVDNKEIPVVIGSGAVVKVNGNNIESFGDNSKLGKNYSIRLFNIRMDSIYERLSGCDKSLNLESNKKILDFFIQNQNYTRHEWGDREKPETWAQNKYVEKLGLKKQDGNEKYYPKGIINHATINQLNKNKDQKPEKTKKFVGTVTDHNLREQDATRIAASTIREIINEKGGNTDDFRSFLKDRENSKNDITRR
ncbi:MAG: hypothetical protein R3D71_05535 [Rickettsiales bacterium]